MLVNSVAVVGGGLSGLAIAYYASQTWSQCRIDIYDPCSPGSGGASSLACLMHPHTPKGRLIWKGIEGMEASLELMNFAEKFCPSSRSVFHLKEKAIQRVCLSRSQADIFMKAADDFPEFLEFSPPIDSPTNGHFGTTLLKQSYIVDTPLYLKSLYNGICSYCNLSWKQSTIDDASLSELPSCYDLVVVCAGAGVKELWKDTPLTMLTHDRGQNIVYKLREEFKGKRRLEHALLSGEYIVPTEAGTLTCGATHEYDAEVIFTPPDLDFALRALSPALQAIYPLHDRDYWPSHAAAGVRMLPQRTHLGRIPIIGVHPRHKNMWMMSGLGSHGLIHHAYVAKQLVGAVAGTSSIPEELILPLS